MSYYLDYRPQKTSELDIKIVRDFYKNLLKSGKFSHAYLFSGPRGTGKTSSARILAKLLNCEKNAKAVSSSKPLNEPCNACGMCKKITSSASLSVVEMDAASNRGIDDIRSLREKIGLAPAEGKFIVYIIDEVHMLTTEAFNALLKTLEEPPDHAIFALCTTEFHKLPQTVVSRCTQVLYPKATAEEVKGSLMKAVKGEGLKMSDESLKLLSESVDGSFRDGMKMLEQLASGGKKISDEAVSELTQRTGLYDTEKLVEKLLNKDVKSVLEILNHLEGMGVDFAVLTKRLMETLREKLISEIQKPTGKQNDLLVMSKLVSEAGLNIKDAYLPQLPLELAAVEWCLGYEGVGANEENIGEKKKAEAKFVKSSRPLRKPRQSIPPVVSKVERKQPEKPSPKPRKEYEEGDLNHDEVNKRWPEVLAGVRPLNHSLEALLRASRPKETKGSEVIVEVFYKFHKDRLEEEKHRAAVEDVMSELFGLKVRLYYVLGQSGVKPRVVAKTEEAKKPADSELAEAAEEIFG
ncbi:DNA polymerase III subunit gamma/tau [Patescibacteria group bacterium]